MNCTVAGATPRPGRGGPQPIPRPPGARRGPGAWWSRPGAVIPDRIGLGRVRAAFGGGANNSHPGRADRAGSDLGPPAPVSEVARAELPSGDPRPAAVLCALFEEAGQARVVLTRRSARLRSHTGEVSFPGGRLDPGESALDAALREAREEIGLDPASVEILGELPALSTWTSRAAIRPFVGALPGRPSLEANPDEVDRVFTVALTELIAPGTYHEERWELDPGAGGTGPAGATGGRRPASPVHFFEVPGETIWGATARMLRDLLDVVLPTSAPS